MMNVLNGGVHADNSVDLQEFMIMPVGAPSYREALRWGVETYHVLKGVLHERGLSTSVGDEGGFAPSLASNEDAIRVLMEAIERAGYTPGADIAIALDPAASELFDDGSYVLASEGRRLSSDEMVGFWADLGRAVSDRVDRRRHGRGRLGRLGEAHPGLGERVQLVGDDLFVTNPERLQPGIDARHRQQRAHQGESDRHAHRNARDDARWPRRPGTPT